MDAYRSKEGSSSDSDSDWEIKPPKRVCDTNGPDLLNQMPSTAQKKNNVWAEVLLEETLSQGLNQEVAIKSTDVRRVRRGAESYDAEFKQQERPGRKVQQMEISSQDEKSSKEKQQLDQELEMYKQQDVDTFGSPATVDSVEQFGIAKDKEKPVPEVKSNERKRHRHIHKGHGVKGQRNTSKNGRNQKKEGGSMERKKGAKRQELNTEMGAEQLGKGIAKRLHEVKYDLMVSAVKIVGAEKALELLNQTENVEEAGGLMVLDGSRRRTAGGVFLFLLREDKDIDNEKKKQLFENEKEQNRKYAKVRRRFGRKANEKFTDTLEETKSLLERAKQRRGQVEEGLKPLEDGKDLFLRESKSQAQTEPDEHMEDGELMDDNDQNELEKVDGVAPRQSVDDDLLLEDNDDIELCE